MGELDRVLVTEKVLEFVGEVVEPKLRGEIALGSNLVTDLGLDSVDVVTFTVFLEDFFAGSVNTEALQTQQLLALRTPQNWVDYVLTGELPGAEQDSGGLIDCDALPFDASFRVVDRIERFSQVIRALETTMHWSADDPRISGHRLGGEILVPGVYLAEQINQTALLLGLNMRAFDRGAFVPLRSLVCKFELPVPADSTSLASVEATGGSNGLFTYRGTLMVDRQIVAYVEGEAGVRRDET